MEYTNQNTFSRVLGNDARMGYFPTNTDCVSLIRSHLKIAENINAMDPCVGEGYALQTLCKGVAGISMLGIELDDNRSSKAKECNIEVVNGDFLNGITITSGAFPLVFMNPPYGTVNKEREEKIFLQRVTPYVARGGILVYIVPDYIFETDIVKYIISRYTIEGMWRFPEPEYNHYKQCVLILRRKANSMPLKDEVEKAEISVKAGISKEHILSEGTNEIMVPYVPKEQLKNFHTSSWDKNSAFEFIRGKVLKNNVAVADVLTMKDATYIDIGSPVMDLKKDFKYLMSASGVVHGAMCEGTPYEHLQRGRAKVIEEQELNDSETKATLEVTSRTKITMTVVERDGKITKLA